MAAAADVVVGSDTISNGTIAGAGGVGVVASTAVAGKKQVVKAIIISSTAKQLVQLLDGSGGAVIFSITPQADVNSQYYLNGAALAATSAGNALFILAAAGTITYTIVWQPQ